MKRILIVDDQEDYREELDFALTRRGFKVATAASGREAIDIGTWFRPDVLVADWVLVDQIHGLQVAETLRLLTPDLPLILMSGFASGDLEFEANQVDVFRLLEKPFRLNTMIEAVGAAVASDHSTLRSKPVGAIEVGPLGDIRYASPRAWKWLTETQGGRRVDNIQQILSATDIAKLSKAEKEWVDVKPILTAREAKRAPLHWQVRSRPLASSSSKLLVVHQGCLRLLDDSGSTYSSEFLVRLLLDCPVSHQPRWPFAGRALVIDPSELFRRLATTEIERVAGFCYSVESYESALDVLRKDAGIEVVLIDQRVLAAGGAEIMKSLRELCPHALIVAQGSENRHLDLAAFGVEHTLPRPWQIEELLSALDRSINSGFIPREQIPRPSRKRCSEVAPVC